MMIDRNQKIIARIRRDLRRKGIEITDVEELYDECNRIQKYVIQEVKSVEREVTIETVIEQESYDLIDESAITITDMWNSYDKNMEIVTEDWSSKRRIVGSDPYYVYLTSGKVYLSPIPLRDNDVITFLVRQTDIVNEMDAEIEPEIPQEFDEVLVLGVCSKYDESFMDQYLFNLQKAKGNTSKNSIPQQVQGTW